jgi:hypothetical protein
VSERGEENTGKGLSSPTPGLDRLRTAMSFSEFRELIKLIRCQSKPPIRVPQKQLAIHRREQPTALLTMYVSNSDWIWNVYLCLSPLW